jgi:1,4-dihydroxy-2-naphthoyl-CoA hydrolase
VKSTGPIWFKPATVADLSRLTEGTMVGHLGIRFLEIGPDYVVASMPVDHRTQQNLGLLHGGASVTLAETLGSIGANLCVDMEQRACVGQEINANHVRPMTGAEVIGTARPVHIGQRSQVWSIEIRDPAGNLVCISRLTLATIERNAAARQARKGS